MTIEGVSLRADRLVVPAEDVMFAFGDGLLKYDCVSCQAKCCRGHGWAVDPRTELGGRAVDNAHLGLFLNKHRGLPIVSNLPPACFFLDQNEQCRIHLEDGFNAKPESCRLYPFNNFVLVDRFLIVRPQTATCPLEPASMEAVRPESRHVEQLRILCRDGVGTVVPRARSIVADTAGLIDVERRIAALACRYEGRAEGLIDFIEQQKRLGRRLVSTDETAGDGPRVRESLEAIVKTLNLEVADLLAIKPASARAIVAFTPALRSNLVFAASGSVGSARRRLDLPFERVPNYLLGVAAVSRVAEMAGMRSVTGETLFRLSAEFHPLLWLLAHADTPVQWRSDRRLDLSMPAEGREFRLQFLRLAKTLADRSGRTRVPLGEVITRFNSFRGVEHMAFLRIVADRLAGRVEPLDARPPPSRRIDVRGRIQRRLLASVSNNVLEAACS